ncbi:hypothetical protein SOVF_076990 [Spinacia oleracea]|nr:hypothetical protein SOVF_076990 [Spinacia oleracea]
MLSCTSCLCSSPADVIVLLFFRFCIVPSGMLNVSAYAMYTISG